MSKDFDDELMDLGEEMFWDEFNQKEEDKRYVIVDENGEVVVSDARLTKRKKKIKV